MNWCGIAVVETVRLTKIIPGHIPTRNHPGAYPTWELPEQLGGGTFKAFQGPTGYHRPVQATHQLPLDPPGEWEEIPVIPYRRHFYADRAPGKIGIQNSPYREWLNIFIDDQGCPWVEIEWEGDFPIAYGRLEGLPDASSVARRTCVSGRFCPLDGELEEWVIREAIAKAIKANGDYNQLYSVEVRADASVKLAAIADDANPEGWCARWCNNRPYVEVAYGRQPHHHDEVVCS